MIGYVTVVAIIGPALQRSESAFTIGTRAAAWTCYHRAAWRPEPPDLDTNMKVSLSARGIEQRDADHAMRHCGNGVGGSERSRGSK